MATTQEVGRRAQLKAVAEAYFEGMGKRGSRHSTGGTRGSPRLVCIALSCARRHAHPRTLF